MLDNDCIFIVGPSRLKYVECLIYVWTLSAKNVIGRVSNNSCIIDLEY